MQPTRMQKMKTVALEEKSSAQKSRLRAMEEVRTERSAAAGRISLVERETRKEREKAGSQRTRKERTKEGTRPWN